MTELSALTDWGLSQLQDRVEEEIEARRIAKLPRARVSADARPLYLAGCTGRVGRWKETRREFFPDVGTAAWQRGASWSVTGSAIELI